MLRQADPDRDATEVVFRGADHGPVTIRDNSGVTGGGATGTVEPDAGGGLDLTVDEQFARSMSLAEAMAPDNLLCFEMNGAPLPREHGFPVRLIAPGWYGVANGKWLTRIELTDQRHAGRYAVVGVAWGDRIARVEVRIDDGPWRAATLDRAHRRDGFAWRFWRFDWGTPSAGEHCVRSRAFDTSGEVQPPPDEPYLRSRRTYWEDNGQITRRVRIP